MVMVLAKSILKKRFLTKRLFSVYQSHSNYEQVAICELMLYVVLGLEVHNKLASHALVYRLRACFREKSKPK